MYGIWLWPANDMNEGPDIPLPRGGMVEEVGPRDKQPLGWSLINLP